MGDRVRSRSPDRDGPVYGSGGGRGGGGGGAGNPLSVYCGGIPFDFDDNQLRAVFVDIGVITAVKARAPHAPNWLAQTLGERNAEATAQRRRRQVIKEHETGKPKGYGFVTFQVRGRSCCGWPRREVQQPWQTGLDWFATAARRTKATWTWPSRA
jgi:hypothetical protein